MSKIKYLVIGTILFGFLTACIMAVQLNPVRAGETTSTTFPVDEAGIAAYVKLDSVDISDLTEALNYFEGDRRQGETYVIGKMKIENMMGLWVPHYSYPHLYIGLDGWIVAYYLKDEEASRIMQRKSYTPGIINTTTLKDAIDTMTSNIGVTYSDPIKYYHFQFPDANKMTLIAETVDYYANKTNSFSIVIPGILYEGSYSFYARSGVYADCNINLLVDGVSVYSYGGISCSHFHYGYYDPLQLQTNTPHFIELSAGYGGIGGAATVLIYKTP